MTEPHSDLPRGPVVIDGGLATELEARGFDLAHPLWSARVLLSNPSAIERIHGAYLEAGADCILAATYQASVPGFVAEGLSETQARSVLEKAVDLACEARDRFLERGGDGRSRRPLVAASIGPFGAYLADGSEYTGDYGVTPAELRAYHEPRWEVLSASEADLLACETLPSLREAEVLVELLRDTPSARAWLSFSCRDEGHLSDGTPIEAAAALAADCEQVVAIGVNCTAPRHVLALIGKLRAAAPDKPILVYPNSGETYDASEHTWSGRSDPEDFGVMAAGWQREGASWIGGCCRTGPDHIRAVRAALAGAERNPS